MKTLLVTGASRGIGRAVAIRAAGVYENIAVFYNHSEAQALSLVSEIEKRGSTAYAVKCDVASSASVNSAVSAVIGRFKRIDGLVLAAGIAQQKLFDQITDDDFKQMFDINVGGVFNVIRAAIPSMISNKNGKIVTIASMWGEVGASCEVHYSASKAAVIGLTKALAKEVALSNIEVNCVSPGAIMTDMLSEFSPDDLAALAEETPLQRIGTPDDVATAVMFLLQSASFITGEVLRVNGGLVL